MNHLRPEYAVYLNIDAAYTELTQRGAVFTVPPRTIRPGVRIAFVQAPENVRIELLERT